MFRIHRTPRIGEKGGEELGPLGQLAHRDKDGPGVQFSMLFSCNQACDKKDSSLCCPPVRLQRKGMASETESERYTIRERSAFV